MSEESGNLSEGTASEGSISKPDKVSGSERDNMDVGDKLTSDSGAGNRVVSGEASLSNNQFINYFLALIGVFCTFQFHGTLMLLQEVFVPPEKS